MPEVHPYILSYINSQHRSLFFPHPLHLYSVILALVTLLRLLVSTLTIHSFHTTFL